MDKNDKYAIVLDTNCFGEKEKYNFNKSKVTICASQLKEYRNIKIFMPSIVYEEIKKHTNDVIKQFTKSIKGTFIGNYLKSDQIDEIYDKKICELNTFIKNNKIEIIDCNSFANIEEINEWYFSLEKPFEISKPKEFPDAMIVSGIKNYFKSQDYNNVIVVSCDKGLRDAIKEKTKFQVENDINFVMKKLIDIDEQTYRNCESYIKVNNILEKENTYTFSVNDSEEVYEIDSIKPIINNMVITLNEEDCIQVCVNCNLTICGEFCFIDQDMSVYDSEDPEATVIFTKEGKTINVKNNDVFVNLYLDKSKKINSYDIEEIDSINLSNEIWQFY